jgi:O-antigen/teichoic acid export membrane protein
VTDGFLAAYGVFIVVALAANAFGVTLLPSCGRARVERRLGSEVAASAISLSLFAAPILIVGIAASDSVAGLLTGEGSELARTTAARALPWMLAAGVGQVYAGVAASALASLDDYVTAAVAFVGGSVAGLALILLRISDDGVQAVAWGMALNAATAVTLPTVALALRARAERMPSGAVRPSLLSLGSRVRLMASGVALPLALQAIYVICLPLASREGEGAVTSFGYAYLLAAGIVGVTASSLGLVTSVPLTRAGLDPSRVARHVDASSWLALVVVAATAGVFAVAGAEIVERVLGAAYGHDVGSQIGQLVVALSPFMVVSVALSVTFPLVFIAGRAGRLPLVGAVVLGVHVPLAFVGQTVAGLWGLSIALALSTALALVWMLVLLRSVSITIGDLLVATIIVGAIAGVVFALGELLLPPPAAATVGLAGYIGVMAAVRPRGLVRSWGYLRDLR